MPSDEFQISFKELHTLRKNFNGEPYFKPLPQYPEIMRSIDATEYTEADLTNSWAENLQLQINNKKHHPNSDIYGIGRYNSKIREKYDGNEKQFLRQKNSDEWFSMDDLITKEPMAQNFWLSSGDTQFLRTSSGGFGKFRNWKQSSYEIIRGMIEKKVTLRNDKTSKHYVKNKGECSRIFDLVNGYYSVTALNKESLTIMTALTMQFIRKINGGGTFDELRMFNPLTGGALSENQEEITFQYENPNQLSQTHLSYRILKEKKIMENVEFELDLDFIIKWFIANEKKQRGSLKNPMSSMGAIQGWFRKGEPQRSALQTMGITPKDLAEIMKSPNTKEIFDEVNSLEMNDLVNFVDDNDSKINFESPYEIVEEWEMERIAIPRLLNLITDRQGKIALEQFRPPDGSEDDEGGSLIKQKLENLELDEKNYLIWITNDPLDIIMSNTSQQWGIRNANRWDGVNKRGYVSCINYNGVYSAGPFFDFYNGNGVAYIAEISEGNIKKYSQDLKNNENEAISPEELFNSKKSKIVGRVSLRWGDKFDKSGKNIGWGIGIEPTAYPKSQKWAEGNIHALATIFKKIKDNKGNSIWDSTADKGGRNATNRITAPYKNGWSYLDYGANGYSNEITKGNYDCDGIEQDTGLIPDYNRGLKVGVDSSSSAAFVQISEGGEIDYTKYVDFKIRDYQDMTSVGGLIQEMNIFGAIEPSIYRTIAQNPQIWISSKSLALVIRGLFKNCFNENSLIRKDFLELALDSTNKNISWLLQPPETTTSIAETFDKYDTKKTWDWGTDCLLKNIFNHPSIYEVFKGHTPDISIQEHLYNQQFTLKDRTGSEAIANASAIFLLNLDTSTISNPKIIPIDNNILSDMIRKLKLSVKGNLKNEKKLPNTIYPQISINWNWWSNRNADTRLIGQTGTELNDKKDLLIYYQLLVINNLAYNPLLNETNYENLCELMGYINDYINKSKMSKRKQKLLKIMYLKAYQSLSATLMYDKSELSSVCYQDREIFVSTIHPELTSISNVFDWAGENLEITRSLEDYDVDINMSLRNMRFTGNSNPLTSTNMNSHQPLQLRKLQNIICLNSWNKIPQEFPECKLTMLYYLYHFMNTPSTYNHLLKIYIEFVNGAKISESKNLSLFSILFDTLIDNKGKLLPCNPYISNQQVNIIAKNMGDTENLQLLKNNVVRLNNIDLDIDLKIRREFNGAALSEFLALLLNSDVKKYGMDNIFLLLRTPRQFAIAEEAMFKLSFGDLVTLTKKKGIRRKVRQTAKYTFTIPKQLSYSDEYLQSLVDNNMYDELLATQDYVASANSKLQTLGKYLISMANNPYLPETMQSRLILSTKKTNAYSIPVNIVEVNNIDDTINSYQTNIHYRDLFTLYGGSYFQKDISSEEGNDLNATLIEGLISNPIISKNTINQLIGDVDESLIVQLIQNAKLDFNNLTGVSGATLNKLLFDMAPEIIIGNSGISDDLRLSLFNIYLTNLFENVQGQQVDSLELFKEFAFNVRKFRSVENITDLKKMLEQLNYKNISMWRGGFSKFPINSSIPNNIQKMGESINENIIDVQKPQIIMDINFKPPYESAFKKGEDYFLTEVEKNQLGELGLEIETTNLMVNEELARLNVEEGYDFENIEDFIENNEGQDSVQPLITLLNQKSELVGERSQIIEQNKTTKDNAPVSLRLRYIESAENTSKGLKLSGSYWDSGRTRVTNKWSEVYPNGWDSVYGWSDDEYGLRADGSKKLWKNQITLVFYDDNPNLGWELINDEGTELPAWRYKDNLCSEEGFSNVLNAMINNMKNPEENLIELLTYYSDFIINSGNFSYNEYDERIISNVINLIEMEEYRMKVYDLSQIFVAIDGRIGWWKYLSIVRENQSIYTQDPILFLMFINAMGNGTLQNLSRPPQVFQNMLQSLDSNDGYDGFLVDNGFIIDDEEGEQYIDVGGTITTDGNINVRYLADWYNFMTYDSMIRTTGQNILKNMGEKIEGVEDDIDYFYEIYKNTINLANSRINEYCKNVLITRRDDLVESMRNKGGGNPEAIIQDAEEFIMTRNTKVNIDEEKIKEYIKKILGSENFA